MGRIAVVGEQLRVQGFALAGALVVPAETANDVTVAIAELPDDVTVVVLTARAADVLSELPMAASGRLTAVMPR